MTKLLAKAKPMFVCAAFIVVYGCGGSGTQVAEPAYKRVENLLNFAYSYFADPGTLVNPGISSPAGLLTDFRFDEFGVWSQVDLYDYSNGMTSQDNEYNINVRQKQSFFLDAAKTIPAGGLDLDSDVNGNLTYNVRVTAGPASGYKYTATRTMDALSNYEKTSESYDPRLKKTVKSIVKQIGSPPVTTYNYSENSTNGSLTYQGTTNFLEESFTFQSFGFVVNYRILPDQTGTFRIEGKDVLLPATGQWGLDGKGTVTFRNGLTLPLKFQFGFVFNPPADPPVAPAR